MLTLLLFFNILSDSYLEFTSLDILKAQGLTKLSIIVVSNKVWMNKIKIANFNFNFSFTQKLEFVIRVAAYYNIKITFTMKTKTKLKKK